MRGEQNSKVCYSHHKCATPNVFLSVILLIIDLSFRLNFNMWNELCVFLRFSFIILKLVCMCVCLYGCGNPKSMFWQGSCTQRLLFPLFVDAKHLNFCSNTFIFVWLLFPFTCLLSFLVPPSPSFPPPPYFPLLKTAHIWLKSYSCYRI